ncbi:MAG: hypothetical protein Q9166_008161 [cf. Caloplaca sp. 2 TL-2023]
MARTRAQGRQSANGKSTAQESFQKPVGKKRVRQEVEGDSAKTQDPEDRTSTNKKRKSNPHEPLNGSSKRKADALLAKYSSLTLSDLGLAHPSSPSPENLLTLIYYAMLTSARISHELAYKSVKCLIEAGYHDVDSLSKSTWEERTNVLTKGGYTRYREKTATALGDFAELVRTKYDGDLNNLLVKAKSDRSKVRELVKEIKGIGNVGIDIFCDTAQGVWPCLAPFIDPRSMKTANQCGLSGDINIIWEAVGKDPDKMCRLAAALTTVRLEKREKEFA